MEEHCDSYDVGTEFHNCTLKTFLLQGVNTVLESTLLLNLLQYVNNFETYATDLKHARV
jgi:hypothetical protein